MCLKNFLQPDTLTEATKLCLQHKRQILLLCLTESPVNCGVCGQDEPTQPSSSQVLELAFLFNTFISKPFPARDHLHMYVHACIQMGCVGISCCVSCREKSNMHMLIIKGRVYDIPKSSFLSNKIRSVSSTAYMNFHLSGKQHWEPQCNAFLFGLTVSATE